ncbi:probable carboxylesterase 6 [Magnolia sinica]|uniref:probable carboxylesterase 6 n=1 Tax=Magnolia sinica TaxID=86752 RepID=UPI00265B0E12|nr:probable carboxylesterase 6 [Magnolia sinica]
MGIEKVVVDEVSGWLRVYDDGSIDRSWTGPTEVGFLMAPVPPSGNFIDGVATRDVAIDPSSSLSARIYIPEKGPDDETKLPVLLHFHGGGFCMSRANWYMYHQFYTKLVKSARAICVSVEFRLAPEHKLPIAIDDCYKALLWLRSLARAEMSEPWLEDRAADFSRVFLIGDSTGGNLVHHVAARAASEEWSPLRVAGGVLIHPGFVRAERSKSELELKPDPFLTLEMVDKLLGMALPPGSTKDHPITCPMGTAAAPLAGLKLPPFLVTVAQNDLMRDTELEYVEAMKNAGKDVELLLNTGVGHSFYLNKIAVDSDPGTATQTELLLGAISDFMRRHCGCALEPHV